MQRTLSCQVDLPANFRTGNILAFHQRDAEGVAEQVQGECLDKGILWGDLPARLRIDIGQGAADAVLEIDAPAGEGTRYMPAPDTAMLADTVCHMLGPWCYPDARCVLESGEQALRGAGLSATRSSALVALADGVLGGERPFGRWSQPTSGP